MPLQPLTVTLSDGQKVAALKRFRARYGEELEKLEADIVELMTALAEADFMAQYIGEQPELVELRSRKADLEAKQRRRDYLGKVIDRLDAVIPKQADVAVLLPGGGQPGGGQPGAKPAGLRRY